MFQPPKPATRAILSLAPDPGGRSKAGSPAFIWDPLDPRRPPELGPALPASQARLKLGETPLGQAARQNARAGLESRESRRTFCRAGSGVRAAGAQGRASLALPAAAAASLPFPLGYFSFFTVAKSWGKGGGLLLLKDF